MRTRFSCLLLVLLGWTGCIETHQPAREIDFNFDWRFALDVGEDPTVSTYNDQDWRELNLPHDWSVEFPFDSTAEGATGYLPGGVGYYRKHFKLDLKPDEKCYVLFDGIYNNASFWLNGSSLGTHPYGYTPHYLDLTDHIKPDGENILTVKVDRSRKVDSRWYPGAGIYRDVKLIRVPKLHIPIWGLFISTPAVNHSEASIRIETSIRNDRDSQQTFQLESRVTSPKGLPMGQAAVSLSLPARGDTTISLEIQVPSPSLWSPEDPVLYEAHSRIIQSGAPTDASSSTFGIRTFQFDVRTGFTLNGEARKIKGVCLHQDGGLVGVAVPDGVWRRRLQHLKDAGCNAIRISHHPASESLLHLCDEMGFLVQDEFFDDWDYPKDKRLNMYERHDDYDSRGYTEHFQEWAEHDLKTAILAHRNHPSIFQWSIGNEIEWTYDNAVKSTGFFNNLHWSGNYFWSTPPFSPEEIKTSYQKLPQQAYAIEQTAHKLADWTRELDTTRVVIANCILPSSSLANGYADALDVVGYSYRRVMYDYAQAHYPDKVVMGTENLVQWHEWKAIMERPHIAGTFLWTGIDYLGESNGQWPRKNTPSGMLDLAGFPKASWHMMKSLWHPEPHLYMSTQSLDKSKYKLGAAAQPIEKKPGAWQKALWEWHPVKQHWNYAEGILTVAEIISNCEQVELFLNDSSLGKKQLADFPDRIYKWAVPFMAGELKAVGYAADTVLTYAYQTATAPAQLSLSADTEVLEADGKEVVHLLMQLTDAAGQPVRHEEGMLHFKLEGPFELLGVDNGAPTNVQAFQAESIRTHQGRALMLIQSTREAGRGTLSIQGPSGIEAEWTLHSR